jgi:hypothetical protein
MPPAEAASAVNVRHASWGMRNAKSTVLRAQPLVVLFGLRAGECVLTYCMHHRFVMF